MRKFKWVFVSDIGNYVLEDEPVNAVIRPAGPMWEVFIEGLVPHYLPNIEEAKRTAEEYLEDF